MSEPVVDDLTTQQPVEEAPAVPVKSSGIKAFFGTTIGKIVLIGGALAVLGAIIAVIAVVVLGFLGNSMVQDGIDQAVQTGAPGAAPGAKSDTGTVETKEVPKVPVAVANSEIFTFRDIFEPLDVEIVPSPSEATSSTFAGGEDTLYLLDVVVEDGVRHAVLSWNNVNYTLSAGEVIGGTPWQVVSVGEDSATMLYGDSTVTLRVGQGSVAGK